MRELRLALACLLFCSAECFGQQSTIAWARVRVDGPLAGLVLASAGGTTKSEQRWRTGESATLVLPVGLESDTPRREPRIEWDVGEPTDSVQRGRARFEGWEGSNEDPLAHVPLALRSRPPAPLDEELLALSPGSFVLLGGLLILSLAVRRSRALCIALALAGGTAVWLVGPHAGLPRMRERSVLEGLLGSATWLSVRTVDGRRGLRLAEPGLASVLEPEHSGTRLVLTERGGIWYAECVGELHERRASEIPVPWPALIEAWRRDESGWSYRGPWPAGEPLPAARAGPPPPGWLASGLPQGVGITLGRIQDERWVRVSDP